MQKIIGRMGWIMLPLVLAISSLLMVSCDGGSIVDKGNMPGTYSISGRVTDGDLPLVGVTMTLSGAGSATTDTIQNGIYTFRNLNSGSYTLAPANTDFTFNPSSIAQTVNAADITAVNFTATPNTAPKFSISGMVKLSGSGIAGVTMTLSGAGSATATTDPSGNYTLPGLVDGSYTVTPAKTNFTFTPPSSVQTVDGANITAVDFTATVPSFSISGTVTYNGVGLAGVTMTLSGTSFETATTDDSGSYTLPGLVNGSYTVTPTNTGFTFTPSSSTRTINDASITAVDFTAN